MTTDCIRVKDRLFRKFITEEEIKERVAAVASDISRDMDGKNPLLLAVLNGSFVFAADLVRRLTIPCEVQFVKMSSYEGTASTGTVKELIGISEDLTGRHVVIVEDIVDTGHTMKQMVEQLAGRHPASVSVCTLLLKPDKLQEDISVDYVAMQIPNDFIVGYGLDYDQQGRGLRDIYVLAE